MAFTSNAATDVGKVRLILSDLDSTKPIFPDDAQIQAFLDMEGEIKWAAALGFEVIAGNRALTMQVVQLLDLKLDGKSTALAMLEVAKRLREEGEDWCGLDVAQVVDDSIFAYRDYLNRLLFRGSFDSAVTPTVTPSGRTVDSVTSVDALTDVDALT